MKVKLPIVRASQKLSAPNDALRPTLIFWDKTPEKKKKSLQTIITDVCAEPEGQSWEKHSQKTTREKNGGDAGTPQHLHLSLKQLHVIRRIISRLKELIKSIKLIPLIMDLISSDIATKEPSSHKLFVWGTYLDCMKYFMIK